MGNSAIYAEIEHRTGCSMGAHDVIARTRDFAGSLVEESDPFECSNREEAVAWLKKRGFTQYEEKGLGSNSQCAVCDAPRDSRIHPIRGGDSNPHAPHQLPPRRHER